MKATINLAKGYMQRPRPGISAALLLAAALLASALTGCATWHAPDKFDDRQLRVRAESATVRDVKLSAAVLSAEESRRIFGADVNGAGIQPVWVEVENSTSHTLWLLRAGTDPDYFSPLEVAWSFHTPLAGERNAALDAHFDELALQNPIPPRTTRAGVIFATPHHQTRLLNVDLLGQRRLIPFTLFLPVPDEDEPEDGKVVQIMARHARSQGPDYRDLEALRAALQDAPCCAGSADNGPGGDPVNVVLVGEIADLAAALVRRGFRAQMSESDREQQLFGRAPDVVVRKVSQGGAPAFWLRVWLAPFRYHGQAVLLGQAARPVGGRFAATAPEARELHPDVDEARNLFIQDMMYSGGLASLGFVTGVGARQADQSAGVGYFTDGLRAVMFLVTRPLTLSDLQLLDWVPLLRDRTADAVKENRHAKP